MLWLFDHIKIQQVFNGFKKKSMCHYYNFFFLMLAHLYGEIDIKHFLCCYKRIIHFGEVTVTLLHFRLHHPTQLYGIIFL